MPLAASSLNLERGSSRAEHWCSFGEILKRLHNEGIYIHADQLAEFMVVHGLPVDLQYVPEHQKKKATVINANYQGDMAQLNEQPDDYEWYVCNL